MEFRGEWGGVDGKRGELGGGLMGRGVDGER